MLSTTEAGGDERSSAYLETYAELFEEHCPYYISIGMTYEQFWDGDSTLVRYYRKADAISRERRNQEMWLQGRYVYDALCAVAPIFNSNSKKGTRARKYTDEPYAITEEQAKQKEEEQVKKTYEKGMRIMERLSAGTNKKFREE